LPKDLLRDVRAECEHRLYFRPESKMRALVDETLRRVERRADG
jgi:hypothetical protein